MNHKQDQGKPKINLVFESFPKALLELAKLVEFGDSKYGPGNWRKVDPELFKHAKGRHMIAEYIEGIFDKESGLRHRVHEIWNALAILENDLKGEESRSRNP